MASYVILDDVSFGDEEIDAAFRRWREAIEQANNWSVAGNAEFDAGPSGYALRVKPTPGAKIAKVGGTAIPAMSGSTPGSGEITLYTFDGTTLAAGQAETAFNLHPSATVSANAWIKVIDVEGHWFVFWEPCS
jgi:hypothetical protein